MHRPAGYRQRQHHSAVKYRPDAYRRLARASEAPQDRVGEAGHPAPAGALARLDGIVHRRIVGNAVEEQDLIGRRSQRDPDGEVETGGAGHNRRFVREALTIARGVPDELVALAMDPQTSGGLLAAVPADPADGVAAILRASGVECWAVGRVEAADEPAVVLE